MTALLVVESMFGNTRTIGDCIAHGLREHIPVDVVDAASAPIALPAGTTVLIVGGPTHAFSMSRPSTRQDAVKRGATQTPDRGLREWLADIKNIHPKGPAAAFDTRVSRPLVPGSAARRASRQLRRLGFRILIRPESFYVQDIAGPLKPGEQERAREWGVRLGHELDGRGHLAESV